MADVFKLQASIGLNVNNFMDGIKAATSAGAKLKQSVENQAQSIVKQQTATDAMAKNMSSAANNVQELTRQYNASAKATGENSDETLKLKKALESAQKDLDAARKAEKELSSELVQYRKNADNAEDESKRLGDETKKAGDKATEASNKFEKFGDALKTVASTAGKVVSAVAKISIAAVGAATAGLTALTKQALEASGTYEQLSGGAQKIFDTMDYSVIANDAANAYKDLNMSVNDYLEAINLAGATFAQTMGDKKGYETARTGMLAIADYASGTGKSIDELNQKYQLITRAASSYQSIADQFSGILPATSADFLQQAQAAGYLETSYEKLTDVPVAKYQEAVTKMLEKGVEVLGLSQNTVRESSETITGSLSMVRAAWENLTTAFGSADMPIDTFVSNFVDSLNGAASNVIPRIGEIINSIGTVFPELISNLFNTLKTTIADSNIGESLFNGISVLVTNGADVIEEIMKSLFDNLPSVLQNAADLVGTVGDSLWGIFKEALRILPTKLPKIIEIIGGMINDTISTLTTDLPAITASISLIITKLIEGLSTVLNAESLGKLIPVVVKSIMNIATTILENLDTFIDVAVELVVALGQGIIDSLPIIMDKVYKVVPTVVEALLSNVEPIIEAGFTLLNALLDKMPEILDIISNETPKILYSLTDSLLKHTPDIIMTGFQLLENLFERFPEIIDMGVKFGADLITNLISTFSDNWEDLKQSGIDALTKWWDGARELVDDAATWGSDLISNFVQGIKDKVSLVTETISGVAQTIKDFIGFSEPEKGPLSNFHSYAKDMIDLFTSGLEENSNKIGNTFNKIFGFDENGAFDAASNIFANIGNAVTSAFSTPAVAEVAEAEKTPRNNITINELSINVDANFEDEEQIETFVDRIIPLINERLEVLEIRQRRAIGGSGL